MKLQQKTALREILYRQTCKESRITVDYPGQTGSEEGGKVMTTALWYSDGMASLYKIIEPIRRRFAENPHNLAKKNVLFRHNISQAFIAAFAKTKLV